jgi:hypothetical protein
MKTATTTLPADQMERLASLLADFASELADDGRDDSPDAALIWKVQSITRKAS